MYDTVISLVMHTLIVLKLWTPPRHQSAPMGALIHYNYFRKALHKFSDLNTLSERTPSKLSEGAALVNLWEYCIVLVHNCLSADLYKLSSGCIWSPQIPAGYNPAPPAIGP